MNARFDEKILSMNMYEKIEHYILSTTEMCKLSTILTQVKMLRSKCSCFRA